VFVGIRDVIVGEYYSDNEERVDLWNGFRFLGIDGSKITLPFSKELEEIYGTIKNHTEIMDVIQANKSYFKNRRGRNPDDFTHGQG
jgi:3-methyladenine DNA glycosylase AlkC